MKPAVLKEALLSYYASIEDRDKGVQLIKNHPYLGDELVRLAFSEEQKTRTHCCFLGLRAVNYKCKTPKSLSLLH